MTAAAFHTAERHVSLLTVVRPFLLLAALAFLAGFGGYLILGPTNALNLTSAPQTTASVPSAATAVSAPADDWNLPKHI
jgi:hypothetical protein